jgi:hypothetical protein
MRIQYGAYIDAQRQVSKSNDTCAGPSGSVLPRGRHGSDAVNKFCFPQGRFGDRALGAIHGTAFHEDCTDHVMAVTDVCQQLG